MSSIDSSSLAASLGRLSLATSATEVDAVAALAGKVNSLRLDKPPHSIQPWDPYTWLDHYLKWSEGKEDCEKDSTERRTARTFVRMYEERYQKECLLLGMFPPEEIAMGALMLTRFIMGEGRTPFGETEAGLVVMHLLDRCYQNDTNRLTEEWDYTIFWGYMEDFTKMSVAVDPGT
ncbi:hypothetical protein NEOLEDRAFT_1244307 [Neolentinus lepideus HHB14362 ss-1]|uniref:Uncharacterized protein n=1 Tax=Neolentinus lepideus HHB14362 ss-1 TaxID=1314782 RepID=A0A165Q2W2_9AGAM|nr:hypothetical protein NEOLEDRAFT_1244307 [Neolentinus lepideus HHB14362 ss-1]